MRTSVLTRREAITDLLTSSVVTHLWRTGAHLPYWEPHALAARLEATAAVRFTAVLAELDGGVALAVLRQRAGGILETVVPREPFLTSAGLPSWDVRPVLRDLLAASCAEGVYLREAEESSPPMRRLTAAPGVLWWRRSANPVIEWTDDGAELLDRTRALLGRRYANRARRWARELTVAALQGPAAFASVDRIEPHTWKARAGTALNAGERAFYRSLLSRSPECRLMLCATSQGEPIAYFIEMRVGDTAYGLESSYRQDYGRLSPGTFLTTLDLHRRWRGSGIERFDLLGGRGPLKDAIATSAISRIDIAWPDCSRTRRLRIERQRYEQHWTATSRAGLGVRHVAATYTPEG